MTELEKACEKIVQNFETGNWKGTDRFKVEQSFNAALKPEHMKLTPEVQALLEALEFYADPENRSATLIDEHDFKDKYFKRGYIVDVMEAPYLKDNGNIAMEALKPFEKEGGE